MDIPQIILPDIILSWYTFTFYTSYTNSKFFKLFVFIFLWEIFYLYWRQNNSVYTLSHVRAYRVCESMKSVDRLGRRIPSAGLSEDDLPAIVSGASDATTGWQNKRMRRIDRFSSARGMISRRTEFSNDKYFKARRLKLVNYFYRRIWWHKDDQYGYCQLHE